MMRTVMIDGSQIRSMDELHSLMAREFSFPEWYGRNLQAMSDCLSEVSDSTCILIKNCEELRTAFGDRYDMLMEMLQDAAEENPRLSLSVLCDEENGEE